MKNSILIVVLKIVLAAFVVVLSVAAGMHYESRARRSEASMSTDKFEPPEGWAYVAKSQWLAPGEGIRMVVFTNGSNRNRAQMRCYIYTHKEFQKAQLICPGDGSGQSVGDGSRP